MVSRCWAGEIQRAVVAWDFSFRLQNHFLSNALLYFNDLLVSILFYSVRGDASFASGTASAFTLISIYLASTSKAPNLERDGTQLSSLP